MAEIFSDVSWAAAIVGAVVSFLVGWWWYSPSMFGTGWAAGVKVELGSAEEMPMPAMAAQALGLLLMSWFVAVTAAHGMLLTVILGTLAFTVLAWSGGAFARHSTYALNVSAGFWLVALVIMIIANAIF